MRVQEIVCVFMCVRCGCDGEEAGDVGARVKECVACVCARVCDLGANSVPVCV